MTINRIWRWLSVLLAVLAGGYFVRYAAEHVHELPPLSWDLGTGLLLGASILLWTGIISLGAVIWWNLLADQKHRLDWVTCLLIYNISQFGKYLPGNVGHHVGRVVLSKRAGIPMAATLQAMAIEMAWGIGVASSIALGGVFLMGGIEVSSTYLVMVMAVAMLAPYALLRILRAVCPDLLARISNGGGLTVPALRTMAMVSLLYLAVFMVVGLLLKLHARYLWNAEGDHFLLLTAAFAWSWLAGYLTPGSPAGLGVREAVLVSTLTPVYGAGVAVGLTLTLRAVTTIGDGVAFLVAVGARFLLGDAVAVGKGVASGPDGGDRR